MTKDKERRDFLKNAMIASVAGAGAVSVTGRDEALAEIRTLKMNTEARAVMANGDVKSRADIMKQLGLSSEASADMWLSIQTCGANAGGLTARQREVLTSRGMKFQGAELVAGRKRR